MTTNSTTPAAKIYWLFPTDSGEFRERLYENEGGKIVSTEHSVQEVEDFFTLQEEVLKREDLVQVKAYFKDKIKVWNHQSDEIMRVPTRTDFKYGCWWCNATMKEDDFRTLCQYFNTLRPVLVDGCMIDFGLIQVWNDYGNVMVTVPGEEESGVALGQLRDGVLTVNPDFEKNWSRFCILTKYQRLGLKIEKDLVLTKEHSWRVTVIDDECHFTEAKTGYMVKRRFITGNKYDFRSYLEI